MLKRIAAERRTKATRETSEVTERTAADCEEESPGELFPPWVKLERIDDQFTVCDPAATGEVQLTAEEEEEHKYEPNVQLRWASKDQVPPGQQDWRSGLDRDDTPCVKEEQEELRISQEGQGLKEANHIKFAFIPVPVKSEEDSQLHHTEEESRGSDRLQPDTDDEMSRSFESETDDSCDWEDTSEPQSGLNPPRNNGEPPPGSSERSTSFGLKRRLQEHGGAQTFSCSVCGKKYNWKISLTAHMRVHSERNRLRCSVCKKSFPLRGDFVRHMRIHTGEKPFSCPVCGKGFARKERLTEHVRVNSGEKPFSCSVCGITFARKGNLKQHLRIHTGEKPFACGVCDKGFNQLAHLKKHKCVGDSRDAC